MPLSVGHTIVATIRPHETLVLETIANQGLEHQVIFNKGAVMVLPPGCNKASGLKHALAELGLSPRNVVARGDGENDHALLDMAEYSAATANAIQKLKDAADRVTDDHHGDGVLEIVAGLIETDLARLAPRKRAPRAVPRQGRERAPTWSSRRRRASMLVDRRAARIRANFATALLERLCKRGYQSCVLDTRGDYLDSRPPWFSARSTTRPPWTRC